MLVLTMVVGEAQDRVHLIDVDDPANKELVQFEQVRSFPTIMVVQVSDDSEVEDRCFST